MTTWFNEFLVDRDPRRWTPPAGMPTSIEAHRVFLQAADYGLEVAVAAASRRPTSADMRRAWKLRHGGRPSPVLLTVGYPGNDGPMVAVCGPTGENPPVHFDLDPAAIDRLATIALAEPTRHAAQRCLLRLLPEVESDLPGLVNSGLLATQELRHGVPHRRDWTSATKTGQRALKMRGRSLVEALGFNVTQLGANTSLLTAGADRRAVAVFLDEGETFDAPGARFEGVSPVSHALAVAHREHLSWVVLTRASEIRLYAARPDTGVGRRGPSQTFVEANVALLPDNLAGYLHLLFSANALDEGGTFEQILRDSADFAADLASRLRERVYREAIPALARSIAARLDPRPDLAQLSAAYDQTLNILFRLLFVAYGEDKGLLPYHTNSRYADHSLKRIARRLAEDINRGPITWDDSAMDLWEDVVQIWDAVNSGNRSWGVPPYNGGLFSSDADTNPAGAVLAKLRLTNTEFGPALAALLIDTEDNDDSVGPVDFRSLSVREFGTIYEGLLESELSVAPVDLALDSKGNFVPASRRQPVEVSAGAVYLHNRSGARKTTGSYFTKPFAVEHLLDRALEPALAQHIARIQRFLDEGDDAAASAAFFDFRCADIAMGSGHFLVAAVDRIEARLSAFLALNPIATVTSELDRVRTAAYEALGELSDGVEIETEALLRRQVGRRCIYGVDRNQIAVELARLSIWIHTFVPGLPLSFLDHNLVVGDSLTGIGTIDEALSALEGEGDAPSLFHNEIVGFLDRSSAALRRLATIADASVADVRAARAAHVEALEKVAPATALFDLLVANRLGHANVPVSLDEKRVLDSARQANARRFVAQLGALHFPVAFPEVFLRDGPGFDCLVGNPPWEKIRHEPQQFWVIRDPGLRALRGKSRDKRITWLRRNRPSDAQEEQTEIANREALRRLLSSSFRWQKSQHYDFAKVFAERNMTLVRAGGGVGVVLPQALLVLGGWTPIREHMVRDHHLVAFPLRNRGEWLFDEVHQQMTVCLVTLTPGEGVTVHAAADSLHRFRAEQHNSGLELSEADLSKLSDELNVPWFVHSKDPAIFTLMATRPHLGTGDGWITGTADSTRWDFSGSGKHGSLATERDEPGSWRVTMTRHVDAYYLTDDADGKRINRPERLADLEIGVLVRRGRVYLGEAHPPIIFRFPTNNDNSRTLIATALPLSGWLYSKGYAHGVRFPRNTDTRDILALLGYLNSVPADWWARRFVDRHLGKRIIDGLPLPHWSEPDRELVAGLVASLLRRNGYTDLAGDRPLPPDLHESTRPALRAQVDAFAIKGLGLTADQAEAMFMDFETRTEALPLQARELIREYLATGPAGTT